MESSTSSNRMKLTGFLLSLIFHLILCFVSFGIVDTPIPPTVIPIGLKIIPSELRDDKVIPLIPVKKKKPLIAKKKVVKKKVEKRIVKEGSKKGKVVNVKQRYLYELAKFIERNKIYPKKAKKLKQQGRVLLHFVVDTDGNFQNLKLAKSSSFKSLDNGALKLLQKISTFKPLPSELKVSSLTVTQPITYQID